MRSADYAKSALVALFSIGWIVDLERNHAARAWPHLFLIPAVILVGVTFAYYAWTPEQIRGPGWGRKRNIVALGTLALLNIAVWSAAFGAANAFR